MGKEKSLFKSGLREGLPIGIGYFPLAFTLGVAASNLSYMGLKLYHSLIMGVLSFTAVGQMNTFNLMELKEQYIPIFLSLLIINLRNIVLSLIMAQKIDPKTTFGQKLILAMGNTDEIFALTIRKEGKIPFNYFFGVMTIPYVAWILGLLIGGVAGDILPHSVVIAMNMGLYAMLIAAVVPSAKESKPILYAAVLAGTLSCVLQWLRTFVPEGSIWSGVLQPGGVLISGSLISATIIACLFPKEKEEEKQ